jgi:hypothetical protein
MRNNCLKPVIICCHNGCKYRRYVVVIDGCSRENLVCEDGTSFIPAVYFG